jgi:Histidine phosphatase superfamily (branch 1)
MGSPVTLPPGFEIEKPAAAVPEGFEVEQPTAPMTASIPHPDVAAATTTDNARSFVASQAPSIMEKFWAPIREGAIGRALGISSETAESRREDPSNPLFRFQASTPHPGAARGAAEFASGLTTPENLLLMAGTGGLGALERQLGKGLVSRLVSAGFSADMLHGAYQQIPKLREAWNQQDWPQVRQQLVKLALGTGMAGLAARHAAKGEAKTNQQAGPSTPEPEYTSTGQPIRLPEGFEIEKEKTDVTQPAVSAGAPEAQPQGSAAAEREPTPSAQPSPSPGAAVQPAGADTAAQAQTEVARGNDRDQRPAISNAPERDIGVRGVEPAVPQGNESGPLPGLPGTGRGGSAGGESQPHAGGEGADHGRSVAVRRVTGSANIPLTDRGRQQAADLQAKIPAGTKVFTAPNDRSVETGGSGSQTAPWLAPMRMGADEGKPLNEAGDTINERIRNRPDERPGVSSHSGQEGESFNEATRRIVQGVRQQAAALQPGEAALNITSGRVLEIVDAMRPDGSMDVAKVTGGQSEFSKPGQIYHQTPGGLVPVDAPQPGQNWTTHGETEWNQGAVASRFSPSNEGAKSEATTGSNAPGAPGWVGNVPTSDIQVDAPRFQFKRNVGQGGAGEELREVTKYDPEKAGVTAVWRDPANGKTYVVNGHHRVELAQRTQYPQMLVRYLDAATAQEARLKGALINIAEGRGESTDAAKVFRDSGLSVEELKAEGISLKGKVASEGLALSRLAQPIFDDVIAGDLTPARGAVIGAGVPNHADQIALYDLVKKGEKNGKRLTNDQIEELIRLNNRTSTVTENTADQEQASMFGEEEMTRSLLPEKAIVSDYVRAQLKTERKLFGVVGTQAAAEKLSEGGNVIKAAENAQTAERANQGMMLYDRLSSSAGPIDGILDRAAQRLANGENANDAKQQAYREIRDYLTGQVRQLTGSPAVDDGGAQGLGSEGPRQTGEGQHDQAADVAPPLSIEDFSRQAAEAYDKHKNEGAHIGDALTKEIQFGRGQSIGNVDESPLFGGPAQEDLFADRPPRRGEQGSISAELLTLGADKFWRDDVAPALHDAAKTIIGSADDILKVLAPQLRSPQAKEAGLTLRNRLSEMARRYDRSEAALRQAKRAFDRIEPTENFEFIRRVEAAEKQKAPELDAIAGVLRKMLDERRADVQKLGTGKLQRFYENYFPHVWKDPKRASETFASFFGRRPLEGGKSFLKQRTHLTFEDGLNAGLKPISNNPIDLVMLKVREMDRYLMAHRTLADWKEAGLARFVDAREGKAPAGWRKIDDPIGTVHGQSVQQIAEYPNRGLWRGLHQVADALGVEHRRGFDSLRGAIGRASRAEPLVKTMHGTAEDVLAHEIGHQIDFLAGSGKRFVTESGLDPDTVGRLKRAYATLKDKSVSPAERTAARKELADLKGAIAQRKQFKQELRDLADLREAGSQDYRRSREEKMAQLAEMWVGSRELFQKTAPHVFDEWRKFLNENPNLHALRDIAGDTEVEPIAQPYDVGGLVIRGHYWAPEGAARILNNYLSPGLRTKSGAYRAALGANNVLNQFQLGLSAFHLGFTSADAAVSKGALAIEQALRGKPLAALKSAVQVPLAPFTTAIEGNRVLREWYKPGSEGAPIAAIVDALEKGGGRARMDEFYQTHIGERMAQAFRGGNILGGLVRAPFAGVEAISNLIMKHVVPRQKLGVFADLARLEMERLGQNATLEQTRDVMAKAWDSVENRMGQMTYDNLFWDRTAKDLAMLGVRSVGWNLGTIREIGGAGIDALKIPVQAARGKAYMDVNLHRLSYVASLALTSAAMGALYQYLATGKGPTELKDYYFPKTGELDEAGRPQRMSLPTYVKDVYHYATEPGKTLAGKASPLATLFAEMIRNEDFYNTRIRNEDDPLIRQMSDALKHVAKTAEPFGIRNLERETKLQAPIGQRAQQFIGITPAPAALEKSKAALLASELAHAGVPGGRTHEQAARREQESTIRRLARSGQPVGPEIAKALRSGTITVPEARQAIAQAHMDPLARTFKGLTLEQALKVWKVASAAEKRRLKPLLAQKGKTLATKSPAERAVLLPQFAAALRDGASADVGLR